MFEMNPDGPSRPSSSPDIGFEMPAHEMCVERQAVLRRLDGQSEYMTFAINFMPDKIHINGRKFVYEGVADGRGFYREELDIPAQPTTPICCNCGKDLIWEPSIPDTHAEPGHPAVWYCPDCGIDMPARDCDLDSMHETAENATPTGPEIYDTHGSLGSMAAALRYAEDLVGGDSLGEHYDSTVEGLDKAHGLHTTASPIGDVNPESELSPLSLQLAEALDAIENTNKESPRCWCPFPPFFGGHYPNCPAFDPEHEKKELLSLKQELQSRGLDVGCPACVVEALISPVPVSGHTCRVPENPPGASVEVHIPAENATPEPRMQCSRCSKLLDLVSEMIENPPGLSGIKCHLGHVGNQYVDAGWVEALTRVKAHLVTGSSGTRDKV